MYLFSYILDNISSYMHNLAFCDISLLLGSFMTKLIRIRTERFQLKR